jgi:FtsH-binding integral membrane protein
MSIRYSSQDQDTIISVSPTQQLAISRFVTRTYGWMFLGLALTGLVSFLIASSPTAVGAVLENRWAFMGCILAEFGLVIGLTAAWRRLSAAAATMGFLLYAALNGVTFAVIFLVYTMSSIAQVFFITSAMFGGLALFGTVTKRDLTGIGTFMAMGVWGMILVSLVNVFMQSNALSLGMSVAGVIIFSGLAAYDAQKIKAIAYASTTNGMSTGEADKGAIFGALALYLDFINLFLSLLRLFGERRN